MPYSPLLCLMLIFALPVHGQIVKNKTLSREVLFQTGSSRIDSAQLRNIAFICEEVHERDNYRIRLKGNTDSVGTYHANLVLSEARAKAVRKELVSCGVADSLIDHSALSFTEPKMSNSTEEGQAKNRRTKISLTLIYFSVSALEPVDALKPGATLDLKVLFNFNSAEIKPASKDKLTEILTLLKQYPDLRFEILGWTAIGQTTDDLSGRRAKAVYDYFLDQGITASRMQHKGMGGAGCAGKDIGKCRRVEIVITRNPYLKPKTPKP